MSYQIELSTRDLETPFEFVVRRTWEAAMLDGNHYAIEGFNPEEGTLYENCAVRSWREIRPGVFGIEWAEPEDDSASHAEWRALNESLGQGAASASTVPQTPTDALVGEIEELRDLPDGWDGEGADAPIPAAINEAVRFVQSVGDRLASRLEPTPDVDGSILLEIGDGGEGSLRFGGDDTIVYAIRGLAQRTSS